MITEKTRKVLSAVSIIAFLLFCALVGWYIGRPMVKFVSEPERFRSWVDESGFMGRVWFVLMVTFQVIIALVPGEPLEIGAGYAFGAIEGTILCLIGIALGSTIVFALVRKYGIRLIEVFFSLEKIKSLKFLQNKKRVAALVFLMFFLPGTPKDLLTYFVGITDIKLKHFALIALFARIPSVVTSTVGGSLLVGKQYIFAIVVFSATLIISLLGWLLYTKIGKIKENKN